MVSTSTTNCWPEGPAGDLPGGPLSPDPTVLAVLAEGHRFAVIPHVLPDVDALGSAEALCRILRAAGKRAEVHAPDIPGIYAWAADPETLATGTPDPDAIRVAIDTARPDRLQVPGPVALNIDHHEDNPGFGERGNWVAEAPACACLLPALARALDVPVDPVLASALYRGLYGDTEGFRVPAGPVAFTWAAWLSARGADCEGTAEHFWQRSPGFWSYLAAVERGAEEVQGGAVPLRVVPIPGDWPDRFELRPYENALLPGHLLPPPGGVLAVLQEGRTGVRFRLRSRGFDVLPLAHRLGGGGHPQAAGVMLSGATLPEAAARLREAWASAEL